MPETTENYHRVPVSGTTQAKQECESFRTITISKKDGIKAVYRSLGY